MLKEVEVNPRHRLHTLLYIYQRHKAKHQSSRSCPSPKCVTKMAALQSYVHYHWSSVSFMGPPGGDCVAGPRECRQLGHCGHLTRECWTVPADRAGGDDFSQDDGGRVEEGPGPAEHVPCPHISIPCNSQDTAHGQHVQYVWGNKLLENFGIETCDQIVTE